MDCEEASVLHLLEGGVWRKQADSSIACGFSSQFLRVEVEVCVGAELEESNVLESSPGPCCEPLVVTCRQ